MGPASDGNVASLPTGPDGRPRQHSWSSALMPGLEDLYREIILDHYRSPRNRGELASPPAQRVEGFNPLCGDEIVVYLDINDGVLVDIKMTGQGCSISQASSSMMSSAVKGKSLEQVRDAITSFKQLMTVHASTLQENG